MSHTLKSSERKISRLAHASTTRSWRLFSVQNFVTCMYLLTYSMEQSPSWEANWFWSQSRNSSHFWNPKVPHRTHKCPPPVSILSQLHPVPTTSPTSWRSILILSSHLRLVSPVVSFPQVSPPEPCAHLSPPPYAPHAPPISFFSILPPAKYWVRSTDH